MLQLSRNRDLLRTHVIGERRKALASSDENTNLCYNQPKIHCCFCYLVNIEYAC